MRRSNCSSEIAGVFQKLIARRVTVGCLGDESVSLFEQKAMVRRLGKTFSVTTPAMQCYLHDLVLRTIPQRCFCSKR